MYRCIPIALGLMGLAIGGCRAPGGNATNELTRPGWMASFTPAQARALSPEEAKAIVVATAEVQRHMTEPRGLRFAVARNGPGWAVTVWFIGGGGASAPGDFVTVYIDSAWNVSLVARGA